MRVYEGNRLIRWAMTNWAHATVVEIEEKFKSSYSQAKLTVACFRRLGHNIPKRVIKQPHNQRDLSVKAAYLLVNYANTPIEEQRKALKLKEGRDVHQVASKCREIGYPIPFRCKDRMEIDPVTQAMFFSDREKMVSASRKPILADAILKLREMLLLREGEIDEQ